MHALAVPKMEFWAIASLKHEKSTNCSSVYKNGRCVGTALVSFARGQHLTKSRASWRALPTTLSHEARTTHSATCDLLREQGGPAVSLLLAAQATRLPLCSTFHHHPGIHLRQCTALWIN